MEFLLPVVGLLILGVAAADLFRTVLDYGGYGPISQRLYRLLWGAARRLARLLPSATATGFLASTGPFMLLASVAAWIIMAAIGFALIYVGFMPELFSFRDNPGHPFLDALYLSAVALSTVGFGDVAAVHPALRLVSAAEALTGFAILTLTISYLFGVYQVIRDQSALAALVEDQADEPTDPLAVATSLMRHDATDATLSDLHREVIAHNEGLHRYPIVYYFRRRLPRRSALFVLRTVGEAAAFMRWVLPASHPTARSPALAGLISAHRRLIADVRDRFLDGNAPAGEVQLDDRWRAAVERMGALDLAGEAPSLGDDRHAAWSAFMVDLEAVVRAAARELSFDESEL